MDVNTIAAGEAKKTSTATNISGIDMNTSVSMARGSYEDKNNDIVELQVSFETVYSLYYLGLSNIHESRAKSIN